MRIRSRRRFDGGASLFLNALAGAAAGALGTWLMSPVIKASTKLQSDRSKWLEKHNSGELNATAVTAKRLAKPWGIELDNEDALKAGNLVHYAHGISTGALFGVLSRRSRVPTLLGGLLLGLGLWVFADEIAVPALDLAPPPERFPLSTHLKGLAAHLAYGAGTGLGYGVLRRPAAALLH